MGSKQSVETLIQNDMLIFGKQDDGRIEVYRKIPKGTTTETAQDSLSPSDIVETTAHGSKTINELFGYKAFDYPKPYELIKHFIHIASDEQSSILDFFAGSCTTAHAVLDLNKQDGGNRKFICVHLPEPSRHDTKPLPTLAKKESEG